MSFLGVRSALFVLHKFRQSRTYWKVFPNEPEMDVLNRLQTQGLGLSITMLTLFSSDGQHKQRLENRKKKWSSVIQFLAHSTQDKPCNIGKKRSWGRGH